MSNTQPPTQQISAQATSDANGNATFTFPMAPQGFVVTGTVSIPGAPILTLVSAFLSGTMIGGWTGSNPWGPIEANPTQTLQLKATSLSPSTAYNAVWMAGTYPVSQAPGNFPGALLTSEIVAVQNFSEDLGTQTSTGGAALDFAGIPPFTEALLLSANAASLTVSYTVMGDQTGTNYFASYGIPITSVVLGFCTVVPIVGLVDNSVTITPSGNVDLTVYALSQVPDLALPPPMLYNTATNNATPTAFGPDWAVALFWTWQVSVYPAAGAVNASVTLGNIPTEVVYALSVVAGSPGPGTGPFTLDFQGTQQLRSPLIKDKAQITGAANWEVVGNLVMTVLA